MASANRLAWPGLARVTGNADFFSLRSKSGPWQPVAFPASAAACRGYADGWRTAAPGHSGDECVMVERPYGRRQLPAANTAPATARRGRLGNQRARPAPDDRTRCSTGQAAAWLSRAGIRSLASPTRMFLPPTLQTVSMVIRRFSDSISMTVTTARTVSPARTGARNFIVWER